MTRPHHYLIRMLLFLSAVGGVWFLLFISFQAAFMANPALNGLIVGVFLVRCWTFEFEFGVLSFMLWFVFVDADVDLVFLIITVDD